MCGYITVWLHFCSYISCVAALLCGYIVVLLYEICGYMYMVLYLLRLHQCGYMCGNHCGYTYCEVMFTLWLYMCTHAEDIIQ